MGARVSDPRPIPRVRITADAYAHTTKVFDETGAEVTHIREISIDPWSGEKPIITARVTLNRPRLELVAEGRCGSCNQPLPLPVGERPKVPGARCCPFCGDPDYRNETEGGCLPCGIKVPLSSWQIVCAAARRGWGAA